MAERWLDAHRYDVVQALTPEGALAAKATGHRTLFSVIGHPGPLTKPGRHDDLRSFTAAAKAADLTSALSTSAAEAAREAFGVEAVVLPPGVRLDVFSPKLRARSGPPVLLFTGDAGDQRKRLSILLQAMPMVQRSLPDVRLVIAGPGDPRASVDPAIAHAIEWRGPGDLGDVADLYRSAHVTIMPSLNEAFGLVLLESLACGTPIVGVRSGATADLVVPDVGRLAEPDDPGTLAVAIIETVSLATAPSTPAACVEQSARWGWEAVGARHLAAYERATGTTR
jgi:phosphatidylinositol alpha-mannosyltransferase